jgi:hypothetical protein
MKKGTIPKASMGVALAVAVAVWWTPPARADLSGGSDTVTYSQGATTLVMPFDQTGNKVSYETVSVIYESYVSGGCGGGVVATHWSFWADDCRHLRDVTICLTRNDTVVVDPSRLHGEIPGPCPPQNIPVTPDFNIGKVRGSVFVTAFAVGTGIFDCGPNGDFATIPNSLIGSWTIADTETGAAFGASAIGLSGVTDGAADVAPDPSVFLGAANGASGLMLQSFNPQSLGDSDVIVLAVDSAGGFGTYERHEWGPIRSAETCCDVEYTDDLEATTSHPRFCFQCSGFAAIAPAGAEAGSNDPVLLSAGINRAGVLHLFDCAVQADTDLSGTNDVVGENLNSDQFLFAYHNQAVGQFGVTMSAFYIGPSAL